MRLMHRHILYIICLWVNGQKSFAVQRDLCISEIRVLDQMELQCYLSTLIAWTWTWPQSKSELDRFAQKIIVYIIHAPSLNRWSKKRIQSYEKTTLNLVRCVSPKNKDFVSVLNVVCLRFCMTSKTGHFLKQHNDQHIM